MNREQMQATALANLKRLRNEWVQSRFERAKQTVEAAIAKGCFSTNVSIRDSYEPEWVGGLIDLLRAEYRGIIIRPYEEYPWMIFLDWS